MARVLMTGANGFVGRHAVAALLQRGHDVVCDERDLLDDRAPREVVSRTEPDAVLHLAWLPCEELGLTPRHSLGDGLAATVRSMR